MRHSHGELMAQALFAMAESPIPVCYTLSDGTPGWQPHSQPPPRYGNAVLLGACMAVVPAFVLCGSAAQSLCSATDACTACKCTCTICLAAGPFTCFQHTMQLSACCRMLYACAGRLYKQGACGCSCEACSPTPCCVCCSILTVRCTSAAPLARVSGLPQLLAGAPLH